MPTFQDMADEYERNITLMCDRVAELKIQRSGVKTLETRRKLQRRINTLECLICESRSMAYRIRHYYDKPEEKPVVKTTKRERGRPRKKFSLSGYGNPAPSAVEHGRKLKPASISGICSVFLGADTTEEIG